MLKAHGDWMDLGGVDEQKPAKEGTVEAWGRCRRIPSEAGMDSRRASGDVSACMSRPSWQALGLCDLEHNPKNNRIRAK